MTETADVIVIGGGIHGCSTALHLAMRGIRVTLLEKDYPGRHSSGVNAGGVRQLARHLAEVPISVFSMSLWEHIVDLVDDDCGFVSHGQVLIAANASEFEAPKIVNAAGAWADRIAAAVGDPVPLQVIAPMLMITAPVTHFIDPVVILRSRKLSFKQFANGTVMIGGGHLAQPYRDENRSEIDWRKLSDSAETVWELFPVMRNATIVRAWAGIEARMPDDIPVIGPSASADGIYHQFGFSAHGFQLGPGVGALVAELIVAGATNLPIAPFRVDRFVKTQTCVRLLAARTRGIEGM